MAAIATAMAGVASSLSFDGMDALRLLIPDYLDMISRD
jgi:hypothetical protein